MAAYEVLLLNTAIPQIQAAQSGDTYVVPRDIAFSTVASFAAGAEATPSIVAAGDTNTGIWFPAADTVAISTGGISRMRLDSSGNLGLGVTPSANSGRLQVQGENATTSYAGVPTASLLDGNANGEYSILRFATSSDGSLASIAARASTGGAYPSTVGALEFAVQNGASSTLAMTLHASGGLSVGNTTDPGVGNIGLTNGGKLQYSATAYISPEDNIAGARIVTPGVLSVATGGTTVKMTLDASGNLGIGETNPTTRLHTSIARAATITSAIFGTTGTGVVNDENRLVIKNINTASGQNFGVGIGGLLEASASNQASLLFYTDSGTATTERARITSGGTLLVGTTNTAQGAGNGNKFDSAGAVWVVNAATNDGFSYYNSSAAAYRFYVGANGTISATNTTISAISDQRLKENIRDLDVGLDAILALKPRKFDWKAGKGKDKKDDRGFIAQEFEQVFPDLIDTWKDPAPEGEEPYKSVRQDLIPVLVKAIQEQQAMINELKTEVAALKGA